MHTCARCTLVCVHTCARCALAHVCLFMLQHFRVYVSTCNTSACCSLLPAVTLARGWGAEAESGVPILLPTSTPTLCLPQGEQGLLGAPGQAGPPGPLVSV